MGKLILFFSASWCKSCQSIKEDVLEIRSRLELSHKDSTKDSNPQPPLLVYIDVDEDPGSSDAHNVQVLPCFVFIDQHDQSVFRYEGSDLRRINSYIDSFVLDDKMSFFELQLAAEDEDAASSIDSSNPIVYPKLCGVRSDSLIFSVDDVDNLYSGERNHEAAHDILATVTAVATKFDQSLLQLSSSDKDLFEFLVPTLSKDGTCSNSAVLSPHPFNLATVVYGLKASSDHFEYQERRNYLTKLHRIVALIYEVSLHAEWIGIYRLLQVDDKHYDSIRNGGLIDGDRVLVKEAYRGMCITQCFLIVCSLCQMIRRCQPDMMCDDFFYYAVLPLMYVLYQGRLPDLFSR